MRTILKGAGIFRAFEPLTQPGTVVVEDDRISAVLPMGEDVSAQAGDRIVDVSGMTIMPGMTTGHWHPDYPDLKLTELDSIYIGQQKPAAYLAAISAKHLRNALISGFTNVVGAGCSGDIDASLKMAIEEGAIEGPRIRAGGRHINTTGADNDRAKWWWELRPPYQAGVSTVGAELFADGVGALKRGVRSEIKRGVEVIKIFPTGGHGIAPDPGYRGFSRDELLAICETAHERGAIVRAHVTGRDAILECIEAGVDIVDHGDGADDDCIEAMLRHGTFLVPSMLFLKALLQFPKGMLKDAILLPVQQDFEGMLDFVPRAHRAGVKIVPGDDYGLDVIPHIPGIYARDLMVHIEEAGIAAQDVLGWATLYGAQMMGRDDLGEIATGKTADLLVVDGDPIADPRLLVDPENNLKAIMMGGRFVKNELADHAASRHLQAAE